MLIIDLIRAFSDNYIWVIRNRKLAWVVDPGDALPVLSYLCDHQLQLTGIALTHWHKDHQGGVRDLCKTFPKCEILGSNKMLDGPSKALTEGDVVDILGAHFVIYEVPGHTLDHIAYVCDTNSFREPVAFTGDTLFAGGCGRLFEGTAEDMFESLAKLNRYPADTKIYCAHEYTEANLQFATHIEPDNMDMRSRLASVSKLRLANQPTLPTTLKLERGTNPFLRAQSAQELKEIRRAKDCF